MRYATAMQRNIDRTKCIVGGIYTYGELLSGRPSMPTVVPRVNKEIADRLLKAITCTPRNDEIQNLQYKLKYLSDSIRDQREKASILRKIELAEQSIIKVSEADAKMQVANLAFMRGLESVDAIGNVIHARSTTVYLEAHNCYLKDRAPSTRDKPASPDAPGLIPVHLGRYHISIDLESRVFPGSIKVLRVLKTNEDDTSHHYWHPHIGQGYFCWGSFAVPAESALHEGQADFLVSILLQHAATANMSSYMTPTYNFMPGRPYYVEPVPMASPAKPARR